MPSGFYWGKISKDSQGKVLHYHPLEAHCADVAASFEALAAITGIRSRLNTASGIDLTNGQISRLAVLTALHDIGKYAPCFQKKAVPGSVDTCGHIQVLAGLATPENSKKFMSIFSWLREWGQPKGLDALLHASLSHHGSPAGIAPDGRPAPSKGEMARFWRQVEGLSPFEALQNLDRSLKQWFPDAFNPHTPPLPTPTPLQHLFAGLVMLADWLASDEHFFPFCGTKGRPMEGDPMPFARQAAARAMVETGIKTEHLRRKSLPAFNLQFPFPPNPLQEAMDQIPLPEPGSVTIIEAETGSGKTEAALRLFSRLFWAGLADGLYFANPLRFAASQLHGRIVEFLRRTFGQDAPPAVLAVPGYLKVDDMSGYRLPGFQVLWIDKGEPVLGRRGWACEHPKRYLSAPVAVGTIDQALLAAMRVPHSHLRAAGLSRSLLVVDEVHASDHYMTELTLGVIRIFRSLGGHVLLMSATLGGPARHRYLSQSVVPGHVDRPHPSLNTCRKTPYPLISTSAFEVYTGESRRSKKVRLAVCPWQSDFHQTAVQAVEWASKGACVLVIRNTVGCAVATQQAIEALIEPDHTLLFQAHGVPTLHHSRFCRRDRELLDQTVLSYFGKDAESLRRPRILVATQTLEQSLDVDFDLLITDLCPMDVLLQRIGRLHRHDNPRPPCAQEAQCYVLVPSERNPEGFFSRSAKRYNYGLERAYEDLRIIEATWRILEYQEKTNQPIEIPRMNRSLVEEATHPEALTKLSQELGPRWEEHGKTIVGGGMGQGVLARLHLVEWDRPFGPSSAAPRSEDARAVTRLGLHDMSVQFADPVPGPFGVPLDQLTIPAWMAPEAEPDDIPQIASAGSGPGLIVFSYAGRLFAYDRLGLRLMEGKR